MQRSRLLLLIILLSALPCVAQSTVRLTLSDAIRLASDSSLTAFRNRNLFLSGYWEYQTFRANRLPSLSLEFTPASYNRYITTRYDYNQNIDVYRPQQIYSASGGLNLQQNIDFLGGTIYVQSELDYMRNIGNGSFNQFSAIPFRIGYTQQLLGYNAFKWDRKIEPLKYEKVKKEYLYNSEQLSEEAVKYFFELALAQAEYRLARENMVSADTLYTIGERRFKIASISQADLLTLKLDLVNARNSLENSRIALKRAMFSLTTFLGMDQNTSVEVTIPGTPQPLEIVTEKALHASKQNSPTMMQHRQNILEARRDLNKKNIERMFSASFNASVGFNQVGEKIGYAYRNPRRQDLISLTVSIPLIDWGVRKGQYNMAKNNLNVIETAARQEELSIEEDVIMTVSDFNIQQKMIASASEAMDLADMAYQQTQKRFIIGKADLNSLTLASNRRQDATKNYITALQNYWLSYYKLRRLTLFDFEYNIPLADKFEIDLNTRLR